VVIFEFSLRFMQNKALINRLYSLINRYFSRHSNWSMSWSRQFSSWLHPLPTKFFCWFLWSSTSSFHFSLFSAS